MNRVLIGAIIGLAAFVELEMILSIQMLLHGKFGQLVATLSQLAKPERDEFVAYIDESVRDEQKRGGSKGFIHFLLSFPQSIGIHD